MRRRRAGFSILEAMVAVGVLGVALIALVKLHMSAVRGVKDSTDLNSAAQVALQLADEMASRPPLAGVPLPCPTPPPAVGCRSAVGTVAAFLPAKNPQYPLANWCTACFAGGGVRLADGTLPVGAASVGGACPAEFPFRVDLATGAHGDAINRPNTNVVNVWVCWQDGAGNVKEVHTSRMVSQ